MTNKMPHERKPALANLQVVSIQHTLAYA